MSLIAQSVPSWTLPTAACILCFSRRERIFTPLVSPSTAGGEENFWLDFRILPPLQTEIRGLAGF